MELLTLILAAAVLTLGVVVGYRRRWWMLWFGLLLGGAIFVSASHVSNDSVSGNSDLGWRTWFLWLSVILPVAFYAGVVAGAITTWTRGTRASIHS